MDPVRELLRIMNKIPVDIGKDILLFSVVSPHNIFSNGIIVICNIQSIRNGNTK